MSTDFQISAKSLGELAMPDFCPRCFWIKHNLKGGLPYQVFPGIFSSIDSYTKKVVHTWFDEHQSAPEWMPELSDAVCYLPAQHHTRFRFVEPTSGVTLTGMVDDLFQVHSGAHVIVDYKTAKFSDHQDALLPIYEVQLNAYALIDESQGNEVSRLLLTYCEPRTSVNDCTEEVYNETGFEMGFTVKTIVIELNPERVVELLIKAREIKELATPPERHEGCKECAKLDKLIALAA
jgi:hypothetical protein